MNLDHIQTKTLLIKSKSELAETARNMVNEVIENGYEDSSDILAKISKAMFFLENAKKEIIDNHIGEELLRDGGKELIRYGVKVSESSTGERLDYDNDEVRRLLTEKLKQRDAIIKLARKQSEPVYDSEGIEVPKVPLKSASKTIYKIQLL